MDPMLKERFREMYYIIEQLRSKDLAPALDWAKRSRAALEIKGSNLEFRLHRLQFIKLLLGQRKTFNDIN